MPPDRHCALRRQKISRPVLSELCPLLLKTFRKPCDTTFFISSKGYNFVSNSKASTRIKRAIWASQASCKTKPSTRLSVFVWKRLFFPPISPTNHLYSVKTITELRIFSKTLSRMKIFENAGHSFTCGRTKTEVFEYDDVMHHLLLA